MYQCGLCPTLLLQNRTSATSPNVFWVLMTKEDTLPHVNKFSPAFCKETTNLIFFNGGTLYQFAK